MKGLTAENERLNELCENLRVKKEGLEKELAAEKKQRTKQVDDLTNQVDEKSKVGMYPNRIQDDSLLSWNKCEV